MDAALHNVIAEIEGNVETKIRRDFESTQAAINAAATSLTDTTNTAVAAHAAAVTADETLVACIATEQSKLAAVEAAEATLAAAREARIQPCAEQDAAAPYSKEFAEQDLVFECDISIAGNCDGPLEEFEQRVNSLLSDLEEDVASSTAVFTAAKARCDAAKAAIVAAENAEAAARDAFQTQRQQCLKDQENRHVSACVFGMDLTTKCTSRYQFEDLDSLIDGTGSLRSEADRMAEWEATAVTKCMLQLIVDSPDLVNVNINEESLRKCTEDVNFARDVGVLDRKTDEFAALTTAEKFTCQETEITFSGFTYNIPVATEDTVVTSAQYEKVAFSVPVSVKGGAKFDFCAVDGQTCGFFQCPFGKVIDATKTCQLSSGCTAAECCPN